MQFPDQNVDTDSTIGRRVVIMERGRAAVILGVAIDASPAQVRDAYRRRARDVHPDLVPGDGAAMAALNEAYGVLCGPPTEPDWEFGDRFAEHAWLDRSVDDALLDGMDDADVGGPLGGALRRFGVALVVVGVALTTLVFIVAVGYDWSVSP